MLIVIYFKKAKDARETSKVLFKELTNIFGRFVTVSHDGERINILGSFIVIKFCFGDVYRMRGLSPNWWYANDWMARDQLTSYAARVNGKELTTLNDITKVIFDYFDEREVQTKG